MKKLTVNMTYTMYGNSTIEIPDDILSFDEAIAYAREHKDIIDLPCNAEYVRDSDELVDEEQWELTEE